MPTGKDILLGDIHVSVYEGKDLDKLDKLNRLNPNKNEDKN